MIVLAVNFALFLAMSERDGKQRTTDSPGITNSTPAPPGSQAPVR
jgi:hypothetical protein